MFAPRPEDRTPAAVADLMKRFASAPPCRCEGRIISEPLCIVCGGRVDAVRKLTAADELDAIREAQAALQSDVNGLG